MGRCAGLRLAGVWGLQETTSTAVTGLWRQQCPKATSAIGLSKIQLSATELLLRNKVGEGEQPRAASAGEVRFHIYFHQT